MEVIARNKKARFQYQIVETIEAGLVLQGTEVKSLRNKEASLDGSFARFKGNEVFLYDMHISTYEEGNRENHEPKRPRKLLLRRREIKKIFGSVQQRGYTLVPLSLYFNKRGIAKVELALVRGKRLIDKREDMKKRDAQREIEREFAARR